MTNQTKIILIIAIVVLLAALALAVYFFVINSAPDESLNINNGQEIIPREEEITDPCAGEQNKEDCYWQKALAESNIDLCDYLESPNSCPDIVWGKIARQEMDASRCTNISNEAGIQECYLAVLGKQFVRNKYDESLCDNFQGNLQFFCEEMVFVNNAGNIEDCDNIDNDYLKDRCLAYFDNSFDFVSDSDNDRLADYKESLLGTDPRNSDTDRDGYSDGEEVANGYNPLGEGELFFAF